jgi:uncharacterized protein YdhG (YjbR/CyaY superfamily)
MSSAEVDAYIAALPDERRGPMSQLRETIRAAAPGAEEVITYKMPGLKLGNRFLVSYDAYKRHYSLFPSTDPMIAALGDELAPYLKGRGTISFPANQPRPLDLIRRIVENRITEHGSAADDRGT